MSIHGDALRDIANNHGWPVCEEAADELESCEQAYALLFKESGSLKARVQQLEAALRSEHEWSEKLSKRVRDAVYASEELKDPLAFKDLDEDFFNGIAASYEAEYLVALAAAGDA